MTHTLLSILGFLAATTAASLFFPQVWSAWRMRRTHDLSWLMILIGVANSCLWLLYGVLKADPFIYVTNSLGLIATLMLLLLKRKYR